MLGVHFAISAELAHSLLAADEEGDSDAVEELVDEMEESWQDDTLKVDSDKAWDALHRCLADGTLDPGGGTYPLSHAVLGGRHLHDEYYAVYIDADQVRAVADALREIDRSWLRGRFDAIDDPDYRGARDDADFDYTWDGLRDVRAFYERAAAAGCAVLFTAS